MFFEFKNELNVTLAKKVKEQLVRLFESLFLADEQVFAGRNFVLKSFFYFTYDLNL